MSVELLTSRISNFFKTFDSFSDSHSFKVKSHKGYSSSWGGIVSIIFFLYAIYYFFDITHLYMSGNFLDIDINRENFPKQEIKSDELTNFHIGFCLRNSENYNSDKYLIDNLDFSLNFEIQKFKNKSLSNKKEKILMDDCKIKKNESDSNNLYNKQMELLDISSCRCIDFSKKNFTLKNYEESFEKDFLSLQIKIKENLNEKNKSNVIDHIEKENPQLSIFFPDVRYNNITNTPNQSFMKLLDYYIDNKATKKIDLIFGEFIFEDFKNFENGKVVYNK